MGRMLIPREIRRPSIDYIALDFKIFRKDRRNIDQARTMLESKSNVISEFDSKRCIVCKPTMSSGVKFRITHR